MVWSLNIMNAKRHLLAAFAAIGLVGAGAALHSGSTTAHATPAASAIPTDGTIADVAERTMDSVVQISVRGQESADDFGDPFSGFGGGGGGVKMGKGSGVIVTANGRVLTNAHVVDGFDDIKVMLQDGSEYDAKVIGKDPKADLAVVQLKGTVPTLKPIAWGDSQALRLGDIVLAVGDGLGVGKSVSMGIVSGKDRSNVNIEVYEDFIQTDAAINPGNSGGALVNLKGELVGINTAIASRSGGSQGIGFAIPSNMARPIMEMLLKDGKVTRGYLGVEIVTNNPQLATKQKLGVPRGVAVGHVDDKGPAGRANLKQGDVIVGFNGQPMQRSEILRNDIAMSRPGTVVALDVVHRDGSKDTLKVKLGQLPDEPKQAQNEQSVPFKVPPGWKCQRTPNGVQCYGNGNGGNFDPFGQP
jgi:S1-C subfamily serine protease